MGEVLDTNWTRVLEFWMKCILKLQVTVYVKLKRSLSVQLFCFISGI